MDKIFINDLLIQCIIGVNKGERKKKQNIVVNLTLFYDISTCGRTDNIQHTIDYSAISKRICEYAETAAHYTLEALSTGIARTIFAEWPQINELIVRVDKPSALYLAKSPAVEIQRNRTWFYMEQQHHKDELEKLQRKSVPSAPSDRQSVVKQQLDEMQKQVAQLGLGSDAAIVYIALGSNIGEKLKNINQALSLLQNTSTPSKFVKLLETSFLYQTAPQYVLDQPSFLNCVCKIVTNMDPDDLLLHVQSIEVEMGRQKLIRFGPRNIDLDIVFYSNIVYNSKKQDLVIPHPRLFERDFVLGPLMDLCPDLIHPTLHKTVKEMFSQLQLNTLQRVLPVNDKKFFSLGTKTFIMAVLNVTPDSFSDGGKFNETQKAVERAKQMVAEGADVIDVGGQSTRPGATLISVEEELARVLPVIQAIKEQIPDTVISIDTFYSKVAREAVQAGAHIVNDVSGGTIDSDMFAACSSLKVPLVIMHMKGTPQTMSNLAKYEDVATEVKQALKTQSDLAIKAGIYRWNILLDPGIGFAKNADHNLELLRPKASLTCLTFPLLYGTSRKGFIGKITGKSDPSQRHFGTAATVAAAIQLGADFLRLHDIAEMKDVILVSDAIYRENWKEPAPQNNNNEKK